MARRKLFSLVTKAEGNHPFPCRTRKLSPPAPMVLPFGGRVGRCQAIFLSEGEKNSLGTPAAYHSTECEERSEPEERTKVSPKGGIFHPKEKKIAWEPQLRTAARSARNAASPKSERK